MVEHVDVPKVLGDIFESVIGAVYLDSNKNINKVWNVIYSLMKNEIGNLKNIILKNWKIRFNKFEHENYYLYFYLR